jgi:hypothetical protein
MQWSLYESEMVPGSIPPQIIITFYNGTRVLLGNVTSHIVQDHDHWRSMEETGWVCFMPSTRQPYLPIYHTSNLQGSVSGFYVRRYGPFFREVLGEHEQVPGVLYTATWHATSSCDPRTSDANTAEYIKKNPHDIVFIQFPAQEGYDLSEYGRNITWCTKETYEMLIKKI